MSRITYDLLRRRAEHNEGIVATLEEVSLHQQDITRIENLGVMCRHLKILYLQNNQVCRLENLHRLKELEYLNMAINNVQVVENLQRCESLTKLDLTLNFVPKQGLLSIASLKANLHLRELFLVGNPCADWPHYRAYIIGTLPQLGSLDGDLVKQSERISARQDYDEIHDTLLRELREEGVDVLAAMNYADAMDELSEDEDEETSGRGDGSNEKGGGESTSRDKSNDGAKGAWTIKQRLKDHRADLKQKRLEEEKTRVERDKLLNSGPKPTPRREAFDPLPDDDDGGGIEDDDPRFFQKNEGKYEFVLEENDKGTALVLDVTVPRFMDTSLMDVDVRPRLVRVLIKGRLLQLRLGSEVLCDKSIAQRSTTTGHLVVTMPLCEPSIRRRLADMARASEQDAKHTVDATENGEASKNDDAPTTTTSTRDGIQNGHKSELTTLTKKKGMVVTRDSKTLAGDSPSQTHTDSSTDARDIHQRPPGSAPLVHIDHDDSDDDSDDDGVPPLM